MSAKVPITFACSLIAFGLGALVGIVVLESVGYQFNPYAMQPSLLDRPDAPSAAPSGPGRGGAGGGAARGPSPKSQLATLVTKLDQLTAKPLAINFTADEKKKVREHLSGLSAKDEISDEDAKKRLDGLLEIIEAAQGNNGSSRIPLAGRRWRRRSRWSGRRPGRTAAAAGESVQGRRRQQALEVARHHVGESVTGAVRVAIVLFLAADPAGFDGRGTAQFPQSSQRRGSALLAGKHGLASSLQRR